MNVSKTVNGLRFIREQLYASPYSDKVDCVTEAIKLIEAHYKPEPLMYEGDGYSDGELVYDTAICPRCHKDFEVDYDEHSKFCPNCGQALDWEKEE